MTRDRPSETPSEDAAWREIVANYGDRPLLDQGLDPGLDPEPSPDQAARSSRSPEAPEVPEVPEVPAELARRELEPAEERFVPPPPPPLPRLPNDRLAAWLGVLASPLLLLLATVLRISMPSLVAWLLVGAFLGGFGYLVATMPRGPRDPYDDGAVL